MKFKILNILTSLLLVTCLTTSCLDDDKEEFDFSANASITAFSINDIETEYKAVVEGKDTTLITTVIGAEYPFSIDQNTGQIFNADSLPYGTDISKVTINITADTYGIFIAAEKDSIWDAADSLNFEKPIQFKVLSQLGSFGRTYTANINVHQQVPDSLVWTKIESNLSQEIKAQKAVYCNGTIYLFAEQDTQVAVTSSENGTEWTPLQDINIPAKADYTSVMAWNGKIYILADNELYLSTDAINWEKVETEQKIAQLTACIDFGTNPKIIGTAIDNTYIESFDGVNWESYETLPTTFPKDTYSYAAYPLESNPNITRVVVMGQQNFTELSNVVWTQLGEEHRWEDLTYDDNEYTCPNLRKPTMIHYNNQLYTFGGPGRLSEAFDCFYTSKDHGINWEKITSMVMFPSEFGELYRQTGGSYSCIVDDNQFIWMMWGNGEVWRGRINKLGFINQ